MINQKRIEDLLTSSYFGRYMHVLPEVDSTNTYAKTKAREGAPEGTVIITENQTNGRGRQGRIWESKPGSNILMSIILRPSLPVQAVKCITLAVATILIRALEVFLKIEQDKQPDLEVKWPNDILLGKKKVAGILTESSVSNHSIEFIVIGIGINVNQDIKHFSPDIQKTANSLFAETGKVIEREKLISHILVSFEKQYISMERSKYENIIEEWKKYWRMAGRGAKIETPVTSEWGEILDINNNGCLLYRTQDGLIKELIAGTLTHE